jgi:hypothetical protein
MLEKRILAVVAVLSLSGCGHLPSMHWPWHRKPAPPPPQVHELDETSDNGGTFPQFWERNTLVVDLQGAKGTGNLVLTPREGTAWPVRIAFKVTPGWVGQLEVRGEQRVVLPITNAGVNPVYLELSPGVYVPKTPKITASWGANPMPAS